jgi:hypothetical protein
LFTTKRQRHKDRLRLEGDALAGEDPRTGEPPCRESAPVLRFDGETALAQFLAKTDFVNRFSEAWSKRPMNFERRIDDLSRHEIHSLWNWFDQAFAPGRKPAIWLTGARFHAALLPMRAFRILATA